MKLVEKTLAGIMAKRPRPTRAKPQGLCLDKGYDFDEVRDIVREFGFTAHIRTRGEEAQAIRKEAGFKARRWVVERTHSWMNRFRLWLVFASFITLVVLGSDTVSRYFSGGMDRLVGAICSRGAPN